MLLEELLEAVKGVRARIEAFRGDLQKSEALTRYALIDPILRALGWDTADPELVRPEFPTESGSPDYALLVGGVPLLMVEAKALGKNLGTAKDKGFQYCWKNKVSYYVITDGNRWEVHDLREMGGKTILQITLDQGEPGEGARALLALWRPAMPAVELPPPTLARPAEKTLPPTARNELSLLKLEEKMRSGEIPRNTPPPLKVIFPDQSERELKYWRDLFVAVVEWEKGLLADKLPIILPSTGKVKIARDPAGMMAPKPAGPYWVETNASARDLVKHALLATKHAGQDPNSIRVILR